MLAGLGRADRHFGMQCVRGRDDDGIDVAVFEKLAPVGVALAAILGREGGQRRRVFAAGRDEAYAIDLPDRARMRRTEIARTDNAYSNHRPAF